MIKNLDAGTDDMGCHRQKQITNLLRKMLQRRVAFHMSFVHNRILILYSCRVGAAGISYASHSHL